MTAGRFPSPMPRPPLVRAALAAVLSGAVLLAGCRGCDPPQAPRGDRVFALLPRAVTTVVALDLRRMRASPLWRAVTEDAPKRAEDRRLLADAKARTGFDPLADLHRIVLAFPEDARVRGEFAVVLEGQHMDERKLIAYARDEAKVRGFDIVQEQVAGQRMWVGRDASTRRAGFFVDATTLVVAGGGWAESIARLRAANGSGSLHEDGELMRLVQRLGADRAGWAAAVVPGAVRTQLASDERFSAAAAITRIGLSLGLDDGVALSARAESSTAEHAQALAAQLDRYVLEARQSAKMLLLGFGPWLQGVRVRAEGPVVTAQLALDAAQTETLAARLAAFIQWGRAPTP